MSDYRVQTDFMNDPEIDVWGYYNLKDSTIAFKDSGGKACESDGEYLFHINGDTLKFDDIKDQCNGRKKNLVGIWIRRKNKNYRQPFGGNFKIGPNYKK